MIQAHFKILLSHTLSYVCPKVFYKSGSRVVFTAITGAYEIRCLS